MVLNCTNDLLSEREILLNSQIKETLKADLKLSNKLWN